MNKPFNDTALLLFSRTCKAEAAAKNFFTTKANKKNQQLVTQLIKHTTDVAHNTGLAFFIIDEKKQQGDSFGEKLSNAIGVVHGKGFEKVIVIGNDCLQLHSKKILAAATALVSHDQVLMPTAKGGVSLIGLNKSKFDSDVFTALPWQTEIVFEALNRLHQDTSVLSTADDVNDLNDLKKNLKHLSPLCYLYAVIKSFIGRLHTPVLRIASHYISRNSIFFGLRAPPVYG